MISSALLKATVICFAPLFFFLQVSGDFKFQCAYINYQGQSCTCGVNQLRGDDSTQLVLIVRGGAISVVPGRGQMIACQCPDKVANRTLTLAACCNSNQIGPASPTLQPIPLSIITANCALTMKNGKSTGLS